MEPELLRVEEVGELKKAIVIAPENVLSELKKTIAGKKGIAGGVFPGVLFDGKVYHDRVVAIQGDFEVYRGQEVMGVNAGGGTLLTLLDGWSERAERMLEEVYVKHGNKFVYIGGGGGSLENRIDCLFVDGSFFKDDVIFIALPERFRIGVRHGWVPTEQTFIATKVEGRRIVELDWDSAFNTYAAALRELGVDIREDDFFDVAKAFPFGVSRVRSEEIVRDPLAVEGESIICAGIVQRNSLLRLMKGDKDSLINAARSCVESVGEVEIVFDCVSRVLYLGEEFEEEARLFKGAFGALTIGEVACERGIIDFHNKTVVVGCGGE